ncbi:DUF4259 domain-containing protein [Pedobacter rhizosphaerae]|uniref:DUF4259 domain-containing protein n=1 Tax=Pedobacter rhizosphaerae TaxID=390241 RepID=A0A1H9UGZ0_9SPHI|nr:DUF4259 domain-containing protein [Pedobacter rhizosphaerae]SES08790.1 protein of unknown function [Pedobacter rhizosphaerae]
MGAWGIKNFENDTAVDWLNDFQPEGNTAEIEEILDQVLAEKDFIDDEESFITLAFLELLAVKLNLTQTTMETNIAFPITRALIEKTIKATHKILFFENHSELRELWEESEEYTPWQDYQSFLIKILTDYLITAGPGKNMDEPLSPVDKNSAWLPPDWNKN